MSRCKHLGEAPPDCLPCQDCALKQLPALGFMVVDRSRDPSHCFASPGVNPHWIVNGEVVAIFTYPNEGLFKLCLLGDLDVIAESPRLCELLLKLRMRGVDL